MSSTDQTLASIIEETLKKELLPEYLEVIDESHGHSRRTAKNPETHFKVIVVSAKFEGLNAVKRQQLVYSFLKPLFAKGLHALSQMTFTPQEWAKNPEVSRSPGCSKAAKPR